MRPRTTHGLPAPTKLLAQPVHKYVKLKPQQVCLRSRTAHTAVHAYQCLTYWTEASEPNSRQQWKPACCRHIMQGIPVPNQQQIALNAGQDLAFWSATANTLPTIPSSSLCCQVRATGPCSLSPAVTDGRARQPLPYQPPQAGLSPRRPHTSGMEEHTTSQARGLARIQNTLAMTTVNATKAANRAHSATNRWLVHCWTSPKLS